MWKSSGEVEGAVQTVFGIARMEKEDFEHT